MGVDDNAHRAHLGMPLWPEPVEGSATFHCAACNEAWPDCKATRDEAWPGACCHRCTHLNAEATT